MPRIMGQVRIRGPSFLPHKKTTLCKNTRNTANHVEVEHFSDIKNHQKIAFYVPRTMGQVKSADARFLPHKQTALCKNTRNTAIRVKVQHFSGINNDEKVAFIMPRIMHRVRIR